MRTWIALFRGINVGGRNLLPMADLRSDLEALKLTNVRTYIQSGNVLFDAKTGSAPSLAKRIARTVEERHRFRPDVLVLDPDALRAAIAANPFPEAVADPKTLHFLFLAEPASDPDTDALEAARAPSERYRLTDAVFYLHAPDGVGRSKLAANAERHLGVVATGRNYRTVEKLRSMAT